MINTLFINVWDVGQFSNPIRRGIPKIMGMIVSLISSLIYQCGPAMSKGIYYL